MGLTYEAIRFSEEFDCKTNLHASIQEDTIASFIHTLFPILQMSEGEAQASSLPTENALRFKNQVIYLLAEAIGEERPSAIKTVHELSKTSFFKRLFENDYKQEFLKAGVLCHHSDFSIPLLHDIRTAFNRIYMKTIKDISGTKTLNTKKIVPLTLDISEIPDIHKSKTRKLGKQSRKKTIFLFGT